MAFLLTLLARLLGLLPRICGIDFHCRVVLEFGVRSDGRLRGSAALDDADLDVGHSSILCVPPRIRRV